MHVSTQPEPGHVPEITVAERCYTARTINRFTMEALAEKIGVSRDTISNYENRFYERKRQTVTLRSWAWACNVPEQWLLEGAAGPPRGGPGLEAGDAPGNASEHGRDRANDTVNDDEFSRWRASRAAPRKDDAPRRRDRPAA